MQTVVTSGGTLATSARLFAAVAMCLGATSAMAAANYWAGADGADLATDANWSENTLPTTAVGYFNGRSEHGTDYTATLSANASFHQLIWGGAHPVPESTVLDLCGKTLTLTLSGARPIRIENGFPGVSVTITNGTLAFSTVSETAWALGSNQTLTFGAGLTFNGNAAIHAAGGTPSTNSMIVAKDGAKVNGRLYVNSFQSMGTILIAGDGTEVNFGGANMVLSSAATAYSNTCYVADGALVTNVAELAFGSAATFGNVFVVSNAEMYANKVIVGDAVGHDCNRLKVAGAGALLRVFNSRDANINGEGASNVVHVTHGATYHVTGTTYLGHGAGFGNQLIVDSCATNIYDGTSKYLYVGCSGATNGTSVFVGDGALLNPRCLGVLGYNNDFTISNGVLKISRLFYVNSSGVGAETCFRFKGAKPQLVVPSGASDPGFGSGVKPKFIFEIPAGGYTAVPIDCVQSWTFPDDAELDVDASAYSDAGGGTLVLARVTGDKKTLTVSNALLSRWNSELAAKRCSVSYDATARTLSLKVKKNTGSLIIVF